MSGKVVKVGLLAHSYVGHFFKEIFLRHDE